MLTPPESRYRAGSGASENPRRALSHSRSSRAAIAHGLDDLADHPAGSRTGGFLTAAPNTCAQEDPASQTRRVARGRITALRLAPRSVTDGESRSSIVRPSRGSPPIIRAATWYATTGSIDTNRGVGSTRTGREPTRPGVGSTRTGEGRKARRDGQPAVCPRCPFDRTVRGNPRLPTPGTPRGHRGRPDRDRAPR